VQFGFVAKYRGIWPVRWICGARGVSHGGFYAWPGNPPSDRGVYEAMLEREIRSSFLTNDRTYGTRRVWRDVLAAVLDCGRQRIERLRGRQAVSARHKAHRHARIVGFLHDRHLLGRRPAATAFGPRQNLALHVRSSH
jgi:putative transposase